MIRGIHYFSAEVKPKLMSSQGAALISSFRFIWIPMLWVYGSPYKDGPRVERVESELSY